MLKTTLGIVAILAAFLSMPLSVNATTSQIITSYSIPQGHDGFTIRSDGLLPYDSVIGIHPINGTDLNAINSNSTVIAEITNASLTQTQINNSGGPVCNVWDPFPNGFHLHCPGNGAGYNMPNAELRVTVINP